MNIPVTPAMVSDRPYLYLPNVGITRSYDVEGLDKTEKTLVCHCIVYE